jgi:hypothetical protein
MSGFGIVSSGSITNPIMATMFSISVIVPRCADERAEVGNDDIGNSKMVINKRCGTGDPLIGGILYEVVIERLSKPHLPSWAQVPAVTQIEV